MNRITLTAIALTALSACGGHIGDVAHPTEQPLFIGDHLAPEYDLSDVTPAAVRGEYAKIAKELGQ